MGKWLLAILVIIVLVQVAKAAVLYLKDDPAAAIRGQPASAPAGDVKDLRDLLEPIRARYKVPALGAAVLHGDRVVALGATGVRKAGGATPVTPEDLWHIGSCTKAMTATLIATFVEEGKLSWDQEIGEFFRASGEQVHPDWDRVTLEHLLSHTAGVPGDVPPPLWAKLWQFKGTPTEARMELVRPTLAAKPKAAPGEKYEYSNTGYAIAGAMAELATGESWESLMGSRLYGPLGITTGGFGAPGTPGTEDQPWGHSRRGKPVEPGPRGDNPPAIGPAGTAHMSVGDWARFVSAHLLRKGADLSSESYERMQTPPPGREYALGWVVTTRGWAKGDGKGVGLTHAGSNTMWHAVTWIAPERCFAVVITCNQGGSTAAKACDDVAGALLKAHMPQRAPAPAEPIGGPR